MDPITLLMLPIGKLRVLDTLIIAVYMVLCLFIGIRNAGNIRNIESYALGNGTISTFVLIASIYATHLGAGLTFGTVEKMREMGVLFALSLFALPVGWLFKMLVFGRNIDQFRGCISQSEIMERLYGSAGSWATTVMTIILAIGGIAAQASALGYVLHYYLSIPVYTGVLLGIGVLIIYSTLGGMRAVAFTDALQFAIFFIAIPYLCATGLFTVGGISGIVSMVPADKRILDIGLKDVPLIAGFFVYAMMYSSDGAFIQRFLVAGNSRRLSMALGVVMWLDLVMAISLCLLGLVIAALMPETSSSKVAFLETISTLLPVGIVGIVVSGLLAIIMSTADSWVNATGVIFAHDVCKRLRPRLNDAQELRIARISTIFIGLAAAGLALTGTGILELIWSSASLYAPIVFIPMVTGFLGFRTTTKSFIGAGLTAIPATLLGAYLEGGFDLVSLTTGVIGSALGLFSTHYWQVYSGILNLGGNDLHKK